MKHTFTALAASCLITTTLAESTAEAPEFPLIDGDIRVGPFNPQYANGITWVVRDQQAYQLVFGFVEKGQLLAEYGKLVLAIRPLRSPLARGDGSHDPHYTWGALSPLIRMERSETRDGSTNAR